MRVARYLGDRRVAVGPADARTPGPGEVQIAVAYTGVCGTDLHIFHGDMDARVEPPTTIGHEMSGRVAALGADVTGWQVGDPVTVMPLVWCDACPACLAGNTHLCHHLVFIGIDAEGSMQSHWVVPAHTLIGLPDRLPLERAALIEPVAVAVHDVRRAELVDGDRVLVIGGGPVGLLIGVIARHSGAQVLLSEPDPGRRALAEANGLRTVDPGATDVAAAVEEWTSHAGADVAFEVSGVSPGVDAAVASLKVRGKLVLVAIHPQPHPVDLFRFFWRELTLVGARLYERGDFERAVALVASGAVDVEPLISRIEPLDDAENAFHVLESGGAMKVLIDCGGLETMAVGTEQP